MPFVLIAVGALLRLSLFWNQKSFWSDEWASIEVARESFRDVIILNAQDAHPPLYFLLLHFSIKFLGMVEWAFRAPQLLAGIVVLPGIYLCARELFGKKTALLTLLFCSISPYFIHLSFEIRNHGLPMLFTVYGSFFFLKALASPKKRWAFAYTACAAAAVYTVHFAWFWVAAVMIWHGFSKKRKKTALSLGWQAFFLSLAAPSIAIFISGWSHGQDRLFFENLKGYKPLTLAKEMVLVWEYILADPQYYLYSKKVILGLLRDVPLFWLSLSAAAVAMALACRAVFRNWFFLSLTLLPVIVVGLVNPSRLDARYFSFAAPFLWMAVALGILSLRKWTQVSSGILIGCALLTGTAHLLFSHTDPMHPDNYIEIIRTVSAQAQKGEAIRAEAHNSVRTHQSPYEYYRDSLALPRRADFLYENTSIPLETLQKYRKVWYLDGEMRSDPFFRPIQNRMERAGFRLIGDEILFKRPAGFPEEWCCPAVNQFERESLA